MFRNFGEIGALKALRLSFALQATAAKLPKSSKILRRVYYEDSLVILFRLNWKQQN